MMRENLIVDEIFNENGESLEALMRKIVLDALVREVDSISDHISDSEKKYISSSTGDCSAAESFEHF